VSWSCAGFLKASGQNTVCASAVPSGGRLDTKSPGVHTFRVSDGGVVAAVEYAVAPSCGKLSAGALGRCQAQLSYFKALGLCGSNAACVTAAKLAYKQKLTRIK
jgi:proline racemase